MRRRLLANTLALTVAQVVEYIAPFIILVHLTKTLGLEIYGVLAFAQGIITISGVLLDFGYNLSATNKISKNRNYKYYISILIGGIYIVKICLFLLCALLITVYASSTQKYSDYKVIFFLSLIPILIQGLIPSWFFHGIEKIHIFASITVIAKIIFAFLAVVFIQEPSVYYLVPVLNGVGQFFALVCSIYFIYRLGYKINFPNLKFLIYSAKLTLHFFVSRVAVASYMNGGIVVLGLTAPSTVVAVYSMAEQLYKVMQSALSPIVAAVYPYMTKEKDLNLMFKLIFGVVGVTIFGACVGFLIAPTLIEIVFDETWLPSVPVLNIFLVAIVIHAAAVMTGYPLAVLVNRLQVANRSVITGASVYFITIVIIFFLDLVVPAYFALAMLLSELFVFFHRVLVLVPLAIKRNINSI